LDHYEFDMISERMLPLEVQKGVSITAKQKAKPLLVHTNGAPLVPGASQAIRGLGELGIFQKTCNL